MATEFTAEFLERRMAEHKRQMHALEYQLMEEIIDEVMSLPRRRPKSMLLDFDPPVKAEHNYPRRNFPRKERVDVHPVNA